MMRSFPSADQLDNDEPGEAGAATVLSLVVLGRGARGVSGGEGLLSHLSSCNRREAAS